MDKSNTTTSIDKESKKLERPIFNGEYEIISSLGHGQTSRVYLCNSVKEPTNQVAIKVLRNEFLQEGDQAIKAVQQEIQTLQKLNHVNIVKILGYGVDGYVKKPSGKELSNLVYIILEYVSGGLLFDLCEKAEGLGEDGGRFFFKQMIDVVSYMHKNDVAHRDLKPENILLDGQLNLKVADFGFATCTDLDNLNSFKGTLSYMAPEIKLRKTYDGRQVDIFSLGVILYSMVVGHFPFEEAKSSDFFYKIILKGQIDKYWRITGEEKLSDDFKDLCMKMFSFDGNKRPTIEEIKVHPWVKSLCIDQAQVQTKEEQPLKQTELSDNASFSSYYDIAMQVSELDADDKSGQIDVSSKTQYLALPKTQVQLQTPMNSTQANSTAQSSQSDQKSAQKQSAEIVNQPSPHKDCSCCAFDLETDCARDIYTKEYKDHAQLLFQKSLNQVCSQIKQSTTAEQINETHWKSALKIVSKGVFIQQAFMPGSHHNKFL